MKPPFPQTKMPLEPGEVPSLFAAVRAGAVYGAAIGLLVGFLYLASQAVSPIEGIVTWRNFILAGAAIGIVAGWVLRLRWASQEEPEAESKDEQPPQSKP